VRAGTKLALCAASIGLLAGCGATATPNPAAVRLRQEDLIALSHALQSPESSVASELAATKVAWPLVANGLPANTGSLSRAPIRTAAERAAQIKLPALLSEQQAASLTGPASAIAGLFRAYAGLGSRGWQLLGSSLDQIEHGSPASARFARENVDLYIESVYDGHFDLAQIGKKLQSAYRTLGGAPAFGSALTQAEINALADTYSEANDRLHPHTGVRLGS
jgi:hypothetical protein